MKIVKSQDVHYSVPISKIQRTTIEHKEEDNRWIITATCDRPLVLARYNSEAEAIIAVTNMWVSEEQVYTFPAPGEKS